MSKIIRTEKWILDVENKVLEFLEGTITVPPYFLEYIYTINLTNAMYDKGQAGSFRTAAPPGPGMLPENVIKGYGSANLERSIGEMMVGLRFDEGLQEFGTFLTKTVRSKGRGRAPRVVGHLDGLTVVFPASLRVIDSLAFTDRPEIATIEFKENCQLDKIGAEAFKNCDILDSDFRNTTLRHIDSSAFHSCYYLKECLLPDTIEIIGGRAFQSTALVEIDLKNVRRVGVYRRDDFSLAPVSAHMATGNIQPSFGSCRKLETIKIGGNLDEETRINHEAFMYQDLHFNIELTDIPGVDSDYANSLCFQRNYRYGMMEASLANGELGHCRIACLWEKPDYTTAERPRPAEGPTKGFTWRHFLKDYVFINSEGLNPFTASILGGESYEIDVSNIFFGYHIGIKPEASNYGHVGLYTKFAEMVNRERPRASLSLDVLGMEDWKGHTTLLDVIEHDHRRKLGGLLIQNPKFAAEESDMTKFRFMIPGIHEAPMVWPPMPTKPDGDDRFHNRVTIRVPDITGEEFRSCVHVRDFLEWAMAYEVDYSGIMVVFNEEPSPECGPAMPPKSSSSEGGPAMPALEEEPEGGPAMPAKSPTTKPPSPLFALVKPRSPPHAATKKKTTKKKTLPPTPKEEPAGPAEPASATAVREESDDGTDWYSAAGRSGGGKTRRKRKRRKRTRRRKRMRHSKKKLRKKRTRKY